MPDIVSLDLTSWDAAITPEAQLTAVRTLERGGVLVSPHLAFALLKGEGRYLSPRWSNGKAKNISLDGNELRGARGGPADLAELSDMVARFAQCASGMVRRLMPRYAPYVRTARTSFRPQPAVGRALSWRKDDSRLHIDAFPSRPNQGERILRVFCNVNPSEDRVWRVGEDFDAMARSFLPRIKPQLPGTARALAWLRVTKGVRSDYDHLMLGLHDHAKADLQYQRHCRQQIVRFKPGTTWMCFSDQVMHAAVSGQHMLEQTIHIPVTALYEPEHAPRATPERLCGRSLVTVK